MQTLTFYGFHGDRDCIPAFFQNAFVNHTKISCNIYHL